MSTERIDMTGRVCGWWTVLQEVPCGTRGTRWLCKCKCGNEKTVTGGNLRSGQSKSCGCASLATRRARSPEKTPTPKWERRRPYDQRASTLSIWGGMKRRCLNQKDKRFASYGGRGISVCSAWIEDFSVFVADMGLRPSPDHQLDRIDNDGDYEPANCRWATRQEQMRNTRRAKPVERSDGARFASMSEAIEVAGIDRNRLRSAIATGAPVAGLTWSIVQKS